MKTEITRLPAEHLPTEGPSLIIVPTEAGKTPVARYLQFDKQTATLPAGKPVVAIIRSELLSTPDEIRVTATSHEGQIFRVSIEIRRYTGPLLANVVTIALVEVELGSLGSGNYELTVAETILEFEDLQHPQNTKKPTIKSHQVQFDVR